ncbi:MAG: ABC transporter ATP-binding protein, partial [Acidobacteriota bacterium]
MSRSPSPARSAGGGDRPSGPLRFLLPYFRPYTKQLGLALVATAFYALCSVLLIAVFQVVLSDVLKTDQSVADLAPGGGASSGGADSAEGEASSDGDPLDPASALPFGLGKLDLEQIFQDAYRDLKRRYGIDEQEVVYFIPLLLVIVVVVRSTSQFANGYLFQVIGLGATNDLRNDLYERILRQSSRFYADHPSGELVSRVGNDVAVVQNSVSTRFVDLFQQVPTLLGLIWFLLSLNLKLALACFLLVPAVAYPIARFGKGMRRTSHRSQERLADLSNLVAEAVRGHRVVKAFGMEAFELRRFRGATAKHLAVRLKAQLLAYASGPVIETVAVLGAAGFLIYAGQAVRKGEIEPSTLVTFMVAVLALYDPIRRLNKVNLTLQEALAATHRVMDVIQLPNDIEDAPDAVRLPTLEREIRFAGIRFAYEDKPVLDGIDLVVPKGEVVALVGHSGAGKSTLVNLLPRFFDPSEGAVTLDGVDIRSGTLESLRAQIGIVTQDTVLFNDTVRGNIAYGRDDLNMEQIRAAADAACALDFIEDSAEGFDAWIGEGGLKLSGGQRQRLAIARALVKDPPILILDEATSHLDSEAESLVQTALGRLMEGRTALVIAHRLSTVQRADRIVVMDGGRIVEQGQHEDLLRKG